jgi:hypothetical protein
MPSQTPSPSYPSFSYNLGAGFTYLFQGGGNRITVTFKLFNSKLELFYKEVGKICRWMALLLQMPMFLPEEMFNT